MRTCVGCRQSEEPEHMIRLVLGPGGDVVVDLASRAFGRGAWLHPRAECIGAAPRGLARSFRSAVVTAPEELASRVCHAANRRVESLLASARASGKLTVGTDGVLESISAGAARLLVVAEDARASASALPGEALGRALVWGDKATLGRALGRRETGVVAVLDAGFAASLSRTIGLSKVRGPESGRAVVNSHAPVEVR